MLVNNCLSPAPLPSREQRASQPRGGRPCVTPPSLRCSPGPSLPLAVSARCHPLHSVLNLLTPFQVDLLGLQVRSLLVYSTIFPTPQSREPRRCHRTVEWTCQAPATATSCIRASGNHQPPPPQSPAPRAPSCRQCHMCQVSAGCWRVWAVATSKTRSAHSCVWKSCSEQGWGSRMGPGSTSCFFCDFTLPASVRLNALKCP